VWQTTHTGGHRFAATLVCLPQGICYGWVGPEDSAVLIDHHRQGQIYRLDRYRGRSCYRSIEQAADAFLRAQTGVLDLEAFHLASCEQVEANHWQIEFGNGDGQTRYFLEVESRASSFCNPQSCGKTEGEVVPQYYLGSYRVVG
jgi:hypothetical protein